MLQGSRVIPAWTLAACVLGTAWMVHEVPVAAAAEKSAAKPKTAATRQFTGYVTAVDKGSLTVEKRGKKPQTVVFAKHADMKTTGDVEKDKRVTVYYRDEAGQFTAHRVVVKAGARTAAASGEGSGRKGGSSRGAR